MPSQCSIFISKCFHSIICGCLCGLSLFTLSFQTLGTPSDPAIKIACQSVGHLSARQEFWSCSHWKCSCIKHGFVTATVKQNSQWLSWPSLILDFVDHQHGHWSCVLDELSVGNDVSVQVGTIERLGPTCRTGSKEGFLLLKNGDFIAIMRGQLYSAAANGILPSGMRTNC